jgi:hypothetical protein
MIVTEDGIPTGKYSNENPSDLHWFCNMTTHHIFHSNSCKPKVDEVPEGAWRCPLCALCHSCGGKEIKNENKQKHPYQHAVAPATEHYKYPVYLATYCKVCDDNFENDRFCPVCLKTYSEDEDEEKEDENNDMVACDNCDYWVHVDCDEALTPERYQKLCENENEKYNCPLCDGRVQPITHTGHAALALKGVSAPSGSCVGVVGGKVSSADNFSKKANKVLSIF